MPVLVLTAPGLPTTTAEQTALTTLAHVVAESLALSDNGVVTSLVHSAGGTGWPVLIGYGRPRDPAALVTALAVARSAVAEAWATTPDEVWAQWVLTTE